MEFVGRGPRLVSGIHFLVALETLGRAEVQGAFAQGQTLGEFRRNKHPTNRVASRFTLNRPPVSRLVDPAPPGPDSEARLSGQMEEGLHHPAQGKREHDQFDQVNEQANHTLWTVPGRGEMPQPLILLWGASACAGRAHGFQPLLQVVESRVVWVELV